MPSPGQHNSPKHKGTRRSRTPNKAYDYEDDENEMGAPCFTHRVRITPVPKGFKLPQDQQKYDGFQEPQSWLSDYLQAVKLLGGTSETAMQSLQSKVMVEQTRKRNNRKLGGAHKIIYEQLQVNI
jgi:hypothetical protein